MSSWWTLWHDDRYLNPVADVFVLRVRYRANAHMKKATGLLFAMALILPDLDSHLRNIFSRTPGIALSEITTSASITRPHGPTVENLARGSAFVRKAWHYEYYVATALWGKLKRLNIIDYAQPSASSDRYQGPSGITSSGYFAPSCWYLMRLIMEERRR